MKTTCKYCGIVERPHQCPHTKRKTDRARVDNKVYESKEYRIIRKEILKDHNYICLWSLYVNGKIKLAERVHHIIEITEDETKGKEYSNLIPLSKTNHDIVHRLYNEGHRVKVQGILKNMLTSYREGNRELGSYKKCIEIDQGYPPG